MKKKLMKLTTVIFMLMLALSMLNACDSNAEGTDDLGIEADDIALPISVTIEADGRQITIEDVMGKTVQQLLEEAGITLNEGDVVSINPDQEFAEGEILIQVLRRCKVQILVTDEDTEEELQYTVVLVGGTVSDALEAAGITLADNQVVNYELDVALENGMTIIISIEEEEEEPTTTEQSYTPSRPSSGGGSTSAPATAPTPDPAESTTAAPSNERTIVSVEDYPDCDGSGHGVKVYTYSDGTQEEVPY